MRKKNKGKIVFFDSYFYLMLAQVHSPIALPPSELDRYLEGGWFRMGQTIFTTHFLSFDDRFYSAVWLRVALAEWTTSKEFERISKQNAHFRTQIRPASLSEEQEILFSKYRAGIAFEVSASLKDLLMVHDHESVYQTQEVNVYDGDRLIAAGFFDLGTISAAGISSFYNPDYKRYSLGKYLIYQKINYCKSIGLTYFYPGYFAPGYAAFDYKLAIATPALYYLQLRSQQWIPIGQFSLQENPLAVMEQKLCEVQSKWKVRESKLLYYAFFNANSVPHLTGMELFDFPVLLSAYDDGLLNQVIIYDVRDQYFHFVQCSVVWTTNLPSTHESIYNSHLLKKEAILFSTQAVDELIKRMLR